jgi:hypothetical protein
VKNRAFFDLKHNREVIVMAGKKIFGRRDGVYLRKIDPFMRFFPFIMRGRNESAVYFKQQIDVTELKAYIGRRNRESASSHQGAMSTIFHAVIAAMVKVATERPQVNRFIIGRRMYQRNFFRCAFVIKREFKDDAKEEILIMEFKPSDTLDTISKRIMEEVKKTRQAAKLEEENRHGILNLFQYIMDIPRIILRGVVRFLAWLDYHGWLPSIIINNDPMHTSCFLSNLGSLGVEAPYHHLYEWGTTSAFITVGVVSKAPLVMPDGSIAVRDVMNIAFTLDERISDGYYFAQTIKRFTHLLEHPAELELPSEPGKI